MSSDEFRWVKWVYMSQMSLYELNELKDDKSEENWKNGEKSSKSTYRKVVEKHRHISRSTRSRFSCLKKYQIFSTTAIENECFNNCCNSIRDFDKS